MTTKKKTNKTVKKSSNRIKAGSLGGGKFKFSKIQLLVMAILVAGVGKYIILKSFADTSMTNVNFPPVAIAESGSDTGYLLAASDGGVFNYGGSAFLGSLGNLGGHLSAPIVGIADQVSNGNDTGYFLVGADGAVYAYGSARYAGGLNNYNGGAIPHTGNVVGIAASSNGGYWVVDSTGQIYAFGGAPYYGGSPGGYSGQFVGIAATPSGNGYWLVDNYGQVYTYGDAGYYGGSPGVSNIVGITAGPPGGGYWLVGSDGGVFSYGATYYGSMGGKPLNAPVVGIAHSPDYKGYWLAAADGGIFAFGDAQFEGRPSYTAPAPTLLHQNVSILSGHSVATNVVAGVANSPLAASLTITGSPAHGTASAGADGVITYNSTPGYSGGDSIGYRVCSSIEVAICATSQVSYNVIPVSVASSSSSQSVPASSSSSQSVPASSSSSQSVPASSSSSASPGQPSGGTTGGSTTPSSSTSNPAGSVYGSSGRCTDGLIHNNVILTPGQTGSCVLLLQNLLGGIFAKWQDDFAAVPRNAIMDSATCSAVMHFKSVENSNGVSYMDASNCTVNNNTWSYLSIAASKATAEIHSGAFTINGNL